MNNYSRSLDMKSLVRKLNKTDAHREIKNLYFGVTFKDLDEYLLTQLFWPSVKDAHIPVHGLDFSRITHEDIDCLDDALRDCGILNLLAVADAFVSQRPFAAIKPAFI